MCQGRQEYHACDDSVADQMINADRQGRIDKAGKTERGRKNRTSLEEPDESGRTDAI